VPTKFYLHEALNDIVGTMPGASSTIHTAAPTAYGADLAAGNTRTMTDTIGVAQTSKAVTTAAVVTSQSIGVVRFATPLLAAQTIATQTVTLSGAYSESNTNSDYFAGWTMALWRPSSGAVITRAWNAIQSSTAEAGTTQTAFSRALTTNNALTVLDGDVLLLEIWRFANIQGMGVAYTNTFFYDGTTEASATNCASFLQFTNNVTLYTPPATKSLASPRSREAGESVRGLTLRPRRRRAAA
jgi:hypothetical protein